MRVVKAGSVAGLRDAQAQQRTAELSAEAERQEAIAVAYAAGVEEGVRRSVARGADAAPRGAAALEALLEQVARVHAEEVAATGRTLLSAAVDIAQWVLRHEVSESSRSLLARLQESAGALLPSPGTRVLVAAEDAAPVREWAATRPTTTVVVDAALSPGDASVETDAGSIDVSIAAALRIAREALDLTDPDPAP